MSLNQRENLLFEFPSSSGREKITVNTNNVNFTPVDNTVCSKFYMSGNFWSRKKGEANLITEDYLVCLCQVVLSVDQLKNLSRKLEVWMESFKEFSIDISGDEDQQVLFSLDQTLELICKKDKPALRFNYHGGSMKKFEMVFLVDQTCINLVLEGLKPVVDGINGIN